MTEHGLLALYCVLIVAASLIGGWVPLWINLTHKRMQIIVSAVAGFMFGIAVLHLFPHAITTTFPVTAAANWLLAGFLAMFFIERFFCFHHHDSPDDSGPPHGDRSCAHGHTRGHQLSWSGAAVGLTLHSLIAGVSLAASTHGDSPAHVQAALPGLAVFCVIVLHKPLDSLTLGTLMASSSWPTTTRHMVNALFALAIPVGAALFYLGLSSEPDITAPALAFSAGTFLCIALSDLLPELQFHQHDRLKLSASLLLGLALAYATAQFESRSHAHHDNVAPLPIQPRHHVNDHANRHDE